MGNLRSTFAAVKHKLGVNHERTKFLTRCPAHDDRSPSLSVELTERRILLHCFAGCAWTEVVAALGVEVHDLFDGGPAVEARRKAARCVQASPNAAFVAAVERERESWIRACRVVGEEVAEAAVESVARQQEVVP